MWERTAEGRGAIEKRVRYGWSEATTKALYRLPTTRRSSLLSPHLDNPNVLIMVRPEFGWRFVLPLVANQKNVPRPVPQILRALDRDVEGGHGGGYVGYYVGGCRVTGETGC